MKKLISITIISMLLLFTIFQQLFILKNMERLDDPELSEKFNSLYSELDYQRKGDRLVFYSQSVILMRRFLSVMILIILSKHVIIAMYLMAVLSMLSI